MTTEELIKDLERRIRELEARPVYIPYPVYVPPVQPPHNPYWTTPYPYMPSGPIWISDAGATTTGGNQ